MKSNKTKFCMLVNFSWFLMILLSSVDFFKNWLFWHFFQEHYQSVQQFGSRSGCTFCQSWARFKLFVKVISRIAASKERLNHLYALLAIGCYTQIMKPHLFKDFFKSQIIVAVLSNLDCSCRCLIFANFTAFTGNFEEFQDRNNGLM